MSEAMALRLLAPLRFLPRSSEYSRLVQSLEEVATRELVRDRGDEKANSLHDIYERLIRVSEAKLESV